MYRSGLDTGRDLRRLAYSNTALLDYSVGPCVEIWARVCNFW